MVKYSVPIYVVPEDQPTVYVTLNKQRGMLQGGLLFVYSPVTKALPLLTNFKLLGLMYLFLLMPILLMEQVF